MADFAWLRRLVAAELLAHPRAFGLEHAPVEIADDALERLLDLIAAAAVDEAQRDRSAVGAVEDDAAALPRGGWPTGVEVEVVGAGEAGQHLHVIRAGRVGLGPRHDRALLDREAWLGTTRSSSNTSFSPRPSQAGQAPCGALKQNSRGSISAMVKPRDRAGKFLGEDDAAGRGVVELQTCARRLSSSAAANPLCSAPAVCRARPGSRNASPSASFSAVSKLSASRASMPSRTTMRSTTTSMSCLYFLSSAGLPRSRRTRRRCGPVEACLLPLGELLAVLALTAANDGREEVVAAALGERHHAVDHLADLSALDRQAGRGRIRNADARPQQAHVIVDLGDGGDGRARVAARRLLLDRDGGGEAVDMLDVGLLHHLEELARIGGQALDVAALAFRIDGVEGEARLARTAKAGDDRSAVARDVDVDALRLCSRAPRTEICVSIAALFQLCSKLIEPPPGSTRHFDDVGARAANLNLGWLPSLPCSPPDNRARFWQREASPRQNCAAVLQRQHSSASKRCGPPT